MHRYTRKDYQGWYIQTGSGLCASKARGEAVDRLAAYEDTGLEPEEIVELKGRMEGLEK